MMQLKTTCLSAFLISALLMGNAWSQTMTVMQPSAQAVSPKMSSLQGAQFTKGPAVIRAPLARPQGPTSGSTGGIQAPVQTAITSAFLGTAGVNFNGLNVSQGGYIPSDSNIAVGPAHIVAGVNSAVAIYNKQGGTVKSAVPLSTFWGTLGGDCGKNNGGDVIVLYDRFADRWLISQLGSLSSPYSQCIAVSTSGDPTGTYRQYAYSFGTTLNDYPKFGVWPTVTNSAYLGSFNLFANGSSWAGPQICAYDRAGMIAGNASPSAVCYTGITGASFLPGDVDGNTLPPDGMPGPFVSLNGSVLTTYRISANFSTSPATGSLSSVGTISTAGTAYTAATSVPQPSTTRKLDSLSDRLMYRLPVRVFSDRISSVVSHAVAASGGASGVRWYELRSATPTLTSSSNLSQIYQFGTYSPDSIHRWMSSAAMDSDGNMAIGYSASSSTVFPSIRYTGRCASDALGTLQAEATMMQGSGSQTGYSRWGDYTSMQVDPTDDKTFWYVNEYLPNTTSGGWYTRIGSFKLDGCISGGFTLTLSPSSATVAQGVTTTSSVTLGSTTNAVNLTAIGCPKSAVCSFSPATSTSTSSLSVTPSTETPNGAYAMIVSGNDGSFTRTATFSLQVSPPAINLGTIGSLAVTRGGSAKTTVTVSTSGATTVSFTISGLPSGVTASFSPSTLTTSSATSASTTLTFNASKGAKAGIYNNVKVTASNGSTSSTPPFTLTVQ